ncbi:MAG: sulfatase/phosphatase domain-containing protein, partial [bacterium]
YDEFVLGYNRTMLSVDESVGQIMKTLEELGLLDSTLIIFAGDNGFLFGEHGLIDKRCMYEESIKIPMIAHCPEIIPAGQRSQRLVLNIDVAPTILDAAGLSIPNTIQGMSFLPVARSEKPKWRDAVLYEYFWEESFPQTPTVLGVRTEDYKYMWYHGIFDCNELYNLKEDPHEMVNLIEDAKNFEIRQEMHKRLEELLKQYGATRVPSFCGS